MRHVRLEMVCAECVPSWVADFKGVTSEVSTVLPIWEPHVVYRPELLPPNPAPRPRLSSQYAIQILLTFSPCA